MSEVSVRHRGLPFRPRPAARAARGPARGTRRFRWPRPERFNYARDWFDAVAAGEAGDRAALWILEADGSRRKLSYARAGRPVAPARGLVRRAGRPPRRPVLLMLGNQVELWETMLAAIRLGAVIIPATTLLAPADSRDRIDRGKVRHVVARAADARVFERRARRLHPDRRRRVGGGLARLRRRRRPSTARSRRRGHRAATRRCCSTSPRARRRRPKLVEHTHTSYPSGTSRRCTGSACGPATCTSTSPRRAGPSTPGAASSRPWNAEATVRRRQPAALRRRRRCSPTLERRGVTTFCAPPTVWRMLVQPTWPPGRAAAAARGASPPASR